MTIRGRVENGKIVVLAGVLPEDGTDVIIHVGEEEFPEGMTLEQIRAISSPWAGDDEEFERLQQLVRDARADDAKLQKDR